VSSDPQRAEREQIRKLYLAWGKKHRLNMDAINVDADIFNQTYDEGQGAVAVLKLDEHVEDESAEMSEGEQKMLLEKEMKRRKEVFAKFQKAKELQRKKEEEEKAKDGGTKQGETAVENQQVDEG